MIDTGCECCIQRNVELALAAQERVICDEVLPSEDQAKEPTLLCSGGGAAINLDVLAVPLHYYWMLRRTFLENYNVMS